MKKVMIIALILIGALLIPGVSASVLIDEDLEYYQFTGGKTTVTRGGAENNLVNFDTFIVYDVSKLQSLSYIAVDLDRAAALDEGVTDITYTYNGITKTGRVHVTHSRNLLGQITSSRCIFFFYDWDTYLKSGRQEIKFAPAIVNSVWKPSALPPEGDSPVGSYRFTSFSYTISTSSGVDFRNRLTVTEVDSGNSLNVKLQRVIYGVGSFSEIVVNSSDSTVYREGSQKDLDQMFLRSEVSSIDILTSLKTWHFPLDSSVPDTPPVTVLRTGSVTMTDHNGTTISGFDVRAVNYYTGEEYTVSTDSDVAVITLPMDRTVEIRNPQTGVYEEAPIGYYQFFGYKDGYKMLNEEGIRVSVMPEKYGTYKLCDILVSSESGPLTGKHQFQIRSRSDFSILQTGTISAKSRTTGIWYNTTVVDGLATLILPYDTSDAISEHAGHYYVYATSPGYEDSDYGTQITVYPHTVSEVRTILLTPIGGVPTPGNVTLRIQAISETGQGVPNTEIFIAGVLGAGQDVWDTYTTGWTGFIEVSVPGNSTYDIVARADGYYDSSKRVQVFAEDPPIIEIYLYLSGAPTVEPTTEPTGWVTGPPTTQPTGGIPDEDDDSDGFMMESVRGISNLFGVSFGTGKTILGMLLALGIGTATAKHLRGGAQEFGMGMLGGVVLGVLIGLLPIWVLVLLVLIVGLWIGQRYMSGGDS